jgi:hypothetical protein
VPSLIAFGAGGSERPVAAVPALAKVVLVLALAIQVIWQGFAPRPSAHAAALPRPPNVTWLRAASLGEPIALSHFMTLYLQAFDNQAGISIPFAALDYETVVAWLETALQLDPNTQYPIMMAANLYSQVPDEAKTRRMLEFVREQFLHDPDRRWRWLAHAAIVAKHRLKDMPLALRYAGDIAQHAPGASGWARQMRLFILEDMGEREAAAVLLGGLLAGGEVTDEAEIRFLTEHLNKLQDDEKSPRPSKSR